MTIDSIETYPQQLNVKGLQVTDLVLDVDDTVTLYFSDGTTRVLGAGLYDDRWGFPYEFNRVEGNPCSNSVITGARLIMRTHSSETLEHMQELQWIIEREAADDLVITFVRHVDIMEPGDCDD